MKLFDNQYSVHIWKFCTANPVDMKKYCWCKKSCTSWMVNIPWFTEFYTCNRWLGMGFLNHQQEITASTFRSQICKLRFLFGEIPKFPHQKLPPPGLNVPGVGLDRWIYPQDGTSPPGWRVRFLGNSQGKNRLRVDNPTYHDGCFNRMMPNLYIEIVVG